MKPKRTKVWTGWACFDHYSWHTERGGLVPTHLSVPALYSSEMNAASLWGRSNIVRVVVREVPKRRRAKR